MQKIKWRILLAVEIQGDVASTRVHVKQIITSAARMFSKKLHNCINALQTDPLLCFPTKRRCFSYHVYCTHCIQLSLYSLA
jgi:hypothetical protein